jgi:hypothetical protein
MKRSKLMKAMAVLSSIILKLVYCNVDKDHQDIEELIGLHEAEFKKLFCGNHGSTFYT